MGTARDGINRFDSYMGCVTDNVESTRSAVAELFRACTVLWMKSILANMKATPGAEAAWNEARAAFASANEFLAYIEGDLGDPVLREHARWTGDDEEEHDATDQAAEE